MFACIFASLLGTPARVSAEPAVAIVPDPPDRRKPPSVGTAGFAPSWDLDGVYLWLGPVGAVGRLEATWDSTFGADATVIRIREREALGAVGGTVGASLWTSRGGGRVWLDGIVGTRLGDRMYGLTAGTLVELADDAHPRFGGSLGVWAFFGVTPYARVGIVDELGGFAEVGLHIALPVLRR